MTTIRLSCWRIIEFPDRQRIIAGVNIQSQKPSCSANIVVFDPLTLKAKSVWGTIYELVGEPGSAADIEVEMGIQAHLWDYGIDPETAQDVSAAGRCSSQP